MSDLFEDFVSTVDRSTLECFALCPMQARLNMERHGTVGEAANTGEGVHHAWGQTVASYIDSGGNMGRAEVVGTFEQNLQAARPDIQSQAIEAARASMYGLSELLLATNPINILHHDGGAGDKTGQVAADLEGMGLRVTSEMDFVYAADAEHLRNLDLKSGRGTWDDDDVRNSFQFALHSWLLLQKYESVQVVQVAVWMTRFNRRTVWVDFPRKRMGDYYGRVLQAADAYSRYIRADLKDVPAWPSEQKCGWCPCVAKCPVAEAEFLTEPAALVDQLVVLNAKQKCIEDRLKAHVKSTGQRIRSPSGAMFGTDKPSSRKTFSLWSEKSGDDE